jgi:ribose/xylose/arabinose/galactoside ABC-type transport system permease subunit
LQLTLKRTTIGGIVNSRRIRENAGLLAIWGVLAFMIVGSAIFSPTFRSTGNLFNVLRQSVFLGVVAIGQTIVIIAGGIDLSVGSVVKLVTLIAAGVMLGREQMALPAIALCLGVGCIIGLANGLIVTRLKVPAFIATLGMYSIVRGLAYGYASSPIGSVSKSVRSIYSTQIGPVPLPVIIFALLMIAGLILLKLTVFGRHIYAVGGNVQVARLSALKVDRIKVAVFVISGFLASLAGVLMVSRMVVGDPNVGEGLELDSIAAVALGGTSLLGGRGGLMGTLAGVLILAFVGNIFNLLSLDVWYQQLIKGLIILVAVSIYKQKR